MGDRPKPDAPFDFFFKFLYWPQCVPCSTSPMRLLVASPDLSTVFCKFLQSSNDGQRCAALKFLFVCTNLQIIFLSKMCLYGEAPTIFFPVERVRRVADSVYLSNNK